jgi:hypothetical protein
MAATGLTLTNMSASSGNTGIICSGTIMATQGANGPGSIIMKQSDGQGTNYSGFTVGNMAADVVYVLPTNDGSSGQVLATNGSKTLSWASAGGATAADDIGTGDAAVSIATTSGNITIDAQADDADVIIKVDDNGTAVTAVTFDGSDEGNAIFVNDLKLSSDSAAIHWGADNEVTLTHNHNAGLVLKHTATADDKPVSLILQTGETDMAANDIMGRIDFQAPDEGEGTDAVLVAASIQAIAEGDFSSSSNATTLALFTGKSEAAGSAGGGSLKLSSAGVLALKNTATADDSFPTLLLQTGDTDIAANDVLGTISWQAPDEGAGTDAIKVAAAISVLSEGDFANDNNAVSLHFATAASEQAASKMKLGSGGDLSITTDGASIFFGADSEIELRHVHDDGLIIKHVGTGDGKEPSLTLQAGDNDIAANDVLGSLNFQAPDEGAGTDAILVAAGIEAVSEGDFSSSSNATKLSFKTAASAAAAETMALSSAGVLTLNGGSGAIIIPNDGNIGSAGDTDAIAISSAGVVALSATTEASATGTAALTLAGGLGVAKDIWVGDDIVLDSDAACIKFGDDQEITLTHVADTGLVLSHAATGDDSTVSLTLATAEGNIEANDILGELLFQAPAEGTGTDALLVAGAVKVVSEGDFSSSSNASFLGFYTGASETAALKCKVTSAGHFVPATAGSADLGTSALPWGNVFTQDLHLNNGRGDWVMIEEPDYLTIRNNANGRRYKLLMEDITDSPGAYGPANDGSM